MLVNQNIGLGFDLMKTYRALSKYAIHFVKNHECQLRKDSLAKQSHCKQLFNCIRDIDIEQVKCDARYTDDIIMEISKVENAIICLAVNRTCGMDGIYQCVRCPVYIPSIPYTLRSLLRLY